jgi:hypothetical protein
LNTVPTDRSQTPSAASEVALNAPHMVLAALTWMLCNLLSVFLVYTLPLMLAFDQIEQRTLFAVARCLPISSACP